MSVMSKHLQEYMGDSEAQKKQWMQHFGVNAAGDIVNKKRHDSAVAGMVGAVDNEGNLIDVEKFKKACEAIKAGADAKAQAKTKDQKGKGKSKPSNEIGSKICVRNLHEDTTKEKLTELFQGFGTVVTVDLKTKEGGKCKGFGFVQFRSAEEASKARRRVLTIPRAKVKAKKTKAKARGKARKVTPSQGLLQISNRTNTKQHTRCSNTIGGSCKIRQQCNGRCTCRHRRQQCIMLAPRPASLQSVLLLLLIPRCMRVRSRVFPREMITASSIVRHCVANTLIRKIHQGVLSMSISRLCQSLTSALVLRLNSL